MALCAPAAADVVDLSGVTLGAGRHLGFGQNGTVEGDIAADGNISIDRNGRVASAYAEGSVYFDQGATVAGDVLGMGGINLNRNTSVGGSVLGNHGIWIDQNSSIVGDVSPGLGNSLSTGRNVSIGGSTDPAALDLTVGVGSLARPAHGAHGGQDIWAGRNSTTDLQVGAYKSVSLDRDTTLNLTGGEYTLKSFWMGRDSVVNVDTSAGDVVLNVLGGFSTDRNVQFRTSGEGALRVNVFDGNLWLGNDAKLEGAVRVFGGDFGAGNDATLRGQFFASRDIWLGSGANVMHSMLVTSDGQAVPEPMTAAVLALGGAMLLWKRRRNVNSA